MLTKQTSKFLDSLVPPRFDWLRIGRQFLLRGAFGVFEIEQYDGNSHNGFVGLLGRFTSNEGAQNTIVFRFDELLEPTNPTNNPAFDRHPHLHGYCNDMQPPTLRDWDWYIGRPKSIRPLHDAITAWVEIFDRRG